MTLNLPTISPEFGLYALKDPGPSNYIIGLPRPSDDPSESFSPAPLFFISISKSRLGVRLHIGPVFTDPVICTAQSKKGVSATAITLGSPDNPTAETETLLPTRTFGFEKQYRFSLKSKEGGNREGFAWKHSGARGLELVKVGTGDVLAAYRIVNGPLERGQLRFSEETAALAERFKVMAVMSLVVIVERMRKLEGEAATR